MNLELNKYQISEDKSLLSLDKICWLLEKSYWARERTRETIRISIDNSICYGVYYNGEQVGFARVVTDFATMYWLCDLIIDENHRGKGLGKNLVEYIVNSDTLKGKFGLLATKDAHGLYERYGFESTEKRFMRKPSSI